MSTPKKGSFLDSLLARALKRISEYNYIFYAIALFPTLIAGFMTIMELRVTTLSKNVDMTLKIEERLSYLESLQVKLEAQLSKLETLTRDLGDPNKFSDEDLRKLVRAELSARISDMTERLKRMEDFVVDKPERALATVSLRKDIDLLQKSFEDRIAVVRADTERVYNIIGWSLGAIFIAIVTLLITNLFRRKEAEG